MPAVLSILLLLILLLILSILYLTAPIAIPLIISLILPTIGVLKWIKNLSLIPAKHINELAEKIRTDKDIEDIIYLIEYDIKWYNESFHGNKCIERAVDKTLVYFTHAIYLRKKRIIGKKEFVFFEYNIKRMLSNLQMEDYFYNLYHFSEKKNLPFPFKSLLEYAEKNRLFDNDFRDSAAYQRNSKYHHYLNF